VRAYVSDQERGTSSSDIAWDNRFPVSMLSTTSVTGVLALILWEAPDA
jgi:hypothetical protein